ncbi:MAG: GNAT family N-acetyltransferase [Alphaproteobacteria bacterium]|nr:GNAT family N-acetyltransferase [Alphaproteobacteria bacterium]
MSTAVADGRVVETARLLLRPFTLDDADAYAAIRAKPAVARFITAWDEPIARLRVRMRDYLGEFIAHWDTHGYGPWAMVEKSSGTLIGHHGLRFLPEFAETEILYTLDDTAWGKGYATEGAVAAREFAFDAAGLGHVVALTRPENHGSRRVMERIGMQRAGTVRFRGADVLRYESRNPKAG